MPFPTANEVPKKESERTTFREAIFFKTEASLFSDRRWNVRTIPKESSVPLLFFPCSNSAWLDYRNRDCTARKEFATKELREYQPLKEKTSQSRAEERRLARTPIFVTIRRRDVHG